MADALDGLTPVPVWKYFAELSRIPRCSKHEAAASRFIVDTAARLGLSAVADRAGNVVVRKPAARGFERAPGVCLQGHLDMVCEKTPASTHDFGTDAIELVRRDGALTADGTTLGADNGIAVATNLAIMEDRSLTHGPLELLFTVDEETGLTGARSLEPGFIESRILLNLDSEEEGAIYVGCAGGRDTVATWVVGEETAPPSWTAMHVSVGGLKGGHSGLDIDKGRGNAVKILARVVRALVDAGGRLASIAGGNKRNAIPRDAQAVVCVGDPRDADAIVRRWNDLVRNELGRVDPDVAVTLDRATTRVDAVLAQQDERRVLRALAAVPHGVVKMSADIAALVETSTNLATVETNGRTISVATSQRSSVASEMDDIVTAVTAVFELAGARVEHSDGYPGWKPDIASPILRTAVGTYQSLYGRAPEVKAVHAGLECGIIGEKYPGIDMISFGPTLEGVHTPDEKIHVDTVPRFWRFLLALLAECASSEGAAAART
ncbi:MAG TPA: aminoacyl-histidine dipeptidase [Vicinamibacterales bacterium]|nr:aminoacyl-histidine dipeptidase [Vicinamibacterales bacterium]